MLSTLERSISIVLRANTPTFATTVLLVTVHFRCVSAQDAQAMQASAKTSKAAPRPSWIRTSRCWKLAPSRSAQAMPAPANQSTSEQNRHDEHDPMQPRFVNDRLSLDEMLFNVTHGAPSGMIPRQRFKCGLSQPHATLHRASGDIIWAQGLCAKFEKRNTEDTENHRVPQRKRPFSSHRQLFSFSGNLSVFSVAFLCVLCVKFRKARSITHAPRRPTSDRINDSAGISGLGISSTGKFMGYGLEGKNLVFPGFQVHQDATSNDVFTDSPIQVQLVNDRLRSRT